MSVTVPMSQSADALRSAIERQKAEIEELYWQATADGFFRVQRESPVDTHRFQASHYLSVGSPSDYVEPEGSTHPLKGQDHIDAARSAWKLGDEVYHSSNLPYSELLAYAGWSKQAPEPGWPELAYEASFADQFGGAGE